MSDIERNSLKRPRFLTSNAEVLVCISSDPDIRIRELADRVGITERRAQVIVSDLVESGYVSRERIGRRNRYRVETDSTLTARLKATRSLAQDL
ncbi:MAG: helix-turn-helix transcriptional regulator [Solirubrobacterales bacterium]